LKKAEKTLKQTIEIVEYEDKPEDKPSEEIDPMKAQVKVLRKVDHTKINYINFRKDLYIEVPEIKKMSIEEVKEFRYLLEKMKVRGLGKNTDELCPKPIKSFTQCGLSDKMETLMKKFGYVNPTPIQAQSIPTIMSGHDVIGIAKTGSGKTLAFVLPMLRHILDQPPRKTGEGPIGLVMAPTRELAIQIHAEIKKFKKATKLVAVCVYGGSQVQSQIGAIKRGADILVCTPGRLIDILCLNKGKLLSLERVTFLVLDEADRMFDMGFEKQISHVLQNIRPDRQTVMFSATFPIIVQNAAKEFLNKPVEITVRGGSFVPTLIEQRIQVFEKFEEKFPKLIELIVEFYPKGSILIFSDTQNSVDTLFSKLVSSGYDCLSYHAGLPQDDRESAMQSFKLGEKKILIATSLAARGLDVPSIRLVVNFDCPNHLEDYVHRVGRTGRAGNSGTAVTMICREEEQFATVIVTALKKCNLPIPDELQQLEKIFWVKCENGQAVRILKGYRSGCRGFDFNEEEEKKHMEEKLKLRLPFMDDDEVEKIEKYEEEKEKEELMKKETEENQTTVKEAMEKARQFISQITGNNNQSSSRYTDRLEINDYPQAARYKAMKNSTLNEISELSGTAITAKGQYIPTGKTPPLGQEKLFLFIEGPDKTSVEVAIIELKRILDEASVLNHREVTQKRYNVTT